MAAEAWRATQSEEAPGRVFAVGSFNDFVFCKAGRGGPWGSESVPRLTSSGGGPGMNQTLNLLFSMKIC